MIEVTMYQAADGTIFKSIMAACEHDLKYKLDLAGFNARQISLFISAFTDLYPVIHEYKRWRTPDEA